MIGSSAEGTLAYDFYGDGVYTTGSHHYMPIEGQHTWSNVSFRDIGHFGIVVIDLSKSVVRIGGSPAENVTVTTQRSGVTAAILLDISDSRVFVSHLETTNSPGAYVAQGFYRAPEQSVFSFVHNTIRMAPGDCGGWGGLELADYAAQFWGTAPTLQAAVSNNKIVVSDPLFGLINGIWAFGVSDASITNNVITGEGSAAILMELGSRSKLLANQVNRFTSHPYSFSCDWLDWMGPRAPITLVDTSELTVVLGNSSAGVLLDDSDDPSTPAYDGRNFVVGSSVSGAVHRAALERARKAWDGRRGAALRGL
jgi:hypothetical protein